MSPILSEGMYVRVLDTESLNGFFWILSFWQKLLKLEKLLLRQETDANLFEG